MRDSFGFAQDRLLDSTPGGLAEEELCRPFAQQQKISKLEKIYRITIQCSQLMYYLLIQNRRLQYEALDVDVLPGVCHDYRCGGVLRTISFP